MRFTRGGATRRADPALPWLLGIAKQRDRRSSPTRTPSSGQLEHSKDHARGNEALVPRRCSMLVLARGNYLWRPAVQHPQGTARQRRQVPPGFRVKRGPRRRPTELVEPTVHHPRRDRAVLLVNFCADADVDAVPAGQSGLGLPGSPGVGLRPGHGSAPSHIDRRERRSARSYVHTDGRWAEVHGHRHRFRRTTSCPLVHAGVGSELLRDR